MTGVVVTSGNAGLVVNWVAVGNATGYKVQWKSGTQSYNTTTRQATITSGSTISHTIPGLTNGTEYTVQVTATRTGANDGPSSAEVMGTPEAPGVTVSESALTVTEEDTTGNTYTVVLDTRPTVNVTVTVAGHAGTDVTPTPASLTFTTTNWNTAQTVTVKADRHGLDERYGHAYPQRGEHGHQLRRDHDRQRRCDGGGQRHRPGDGGGGHIGQRAAGG